MEWQQIVGFHAVVKMGSFTRAAESTFRTQSALSQQIKKLEEELECRLFDRIGRQGIRLTTAGRAFFCFSEETLLRQGDFLRELDEIKDLSKGHISIAAPLGILRFLLTEPLVEYNTLHPGVELCIKQRSPQECIDLVMSGEIDCCATHASTIPDKLRSIPWKQGQYVIMVPKGHELTKMDSVGLERLVDYPLVLPIKDVKFTARGKLDEKFAEMGIRYKVLLETTSVLFNADFVSRGMGISFMLCYEPMMQRYAEDIDFIPMNDLFPPETIALATRNKQTPAPGVEGFLDFVQRF